MKERIGFKIISSIYPEEYEYPNGRTVPLPNKWEQIKKRLLQPRPSLSQSRFGDEALRGFKKANAHAFKEEDVKSTVTPIIAG